MCGLPQTGSSPQTPPQREQLAHPPTWGLRRGLRSLPPAGEREKPPALASASIQERLHRQWGQKVCVTAAAVRGPTQLISSHAPQEGDVL